MSSCRGVLIAGATNNARTQIAEGLLRAFTGGSLFIASGGARPDAMPPHPLAVRVMADVGLDIAWHRATSLEAARRQRSTYDVYVSIDAPYTSRQSDTYHQSYRSALEEKNRGRSPLLHDSMLATSTPSHWTCAMDTTDARQQWQLWSPRDPSIYHETSTRKFQDHLYSGEPLFMRMRGSRLRQCCRLSRRWEVEEVGRRFAMETTRHQLGRFIDARNALAYLCHGLVMELEDYYGETWLHQEVWDQYRAAASVRLKAVGDCGDGVTIAKPAEDGNGKDAVP